jgi:CheY-like chemotaxis protein
MRAARVVIVCSQAWVARLVAGALEAQTLQVRVFASTADALAGLQPPVDALVCDSALPGGPAELVRGLRANGQGASIPVLCLVPEEPSGGRLAALQAGVDVCLAQPFRVDELVAQIGALLALTHRLRASSNGPHVAPAAGARMAPRALRAGYAPPSMARSGSGWVPPGARRGGSSAPPPAAHRAGVAEAKGHRASSAPPPKVPPAALEGELAHVSLATVLSLLEMERRSGAIRVDDGGGQTATLDLCFGSAVSGSLGGARVAPLAVLRQVLAWSRGHFRFEPGAVAQMPQGARSLGALLIEAMRLADESVAASDAAAARQEASAAAQKEASAIAKEAPAATRQEAPAATRKAAPTAPRKEATAARSAPAMRPPLSSRPPLGSAPDSSFPPPM